MKTLSKDEVIKDIKENRNHSWIKEIYSRHKNELDREILYYFGNNITYDTFFKESMNLAKAMKANGIKKGDEFVVCIDRIPEFVYLMGAASIIGAKINLISEKFDKDYIKKIITDSKSNIIFIQDNKTDKLNEVLMELNNYNVVTISGKRSLPQDNEYIHVLNKFYNIEACFNKNDYIDYDTFIASGRDYSKDVFENSTLEDAFTITYSSGTTKKGFPKGIVHANRHYITMARYHDTEVSGLPSLKNYTTYSNIPAYSNSYILSSLSDNLILGGKVILDPVDNPDYFFIGVKMHKANMNVATTSTWLINALNYYNGDKYNIKSLPDALFNFAAGESLSAGEEKFLNRFFRDAKCGVNLTHTPISIAKVCTAGADCEHGSIFIKIFRAYFNNEPYRIGRKEPIGMSTYDFVDVKALRRDGTYCNPLEHGRLVVNSFCNMIEYNHNEEETKSFYIKDAYGKIWGDMKAYGFIDEKNNITMKGRYSNDDMIPCYRIADEILKDTKKIMSCEVVSLQKGDGYIYVAHIMPQYGTTFNEEKVIDGAVHRCINKFGDGIQNILFFRIHNFKEMFPITSSIKRNANALQEEGLEKICNYKYKKQETKKKIKVLKEHK